EDRRRCRRAERDHHARTHELELLDQPGLAGADFIRTGLLVDAALASLAELEVLDGVRDVEVASIETRFRHQRIQQLPGWADERPGGEIFVVARLLPHQRDRGAGASLAEDVLGRVLIKRTGPTALALLGCGLQGNGSRNGW